MYPLSLFKVKGSTFYSLIQRFLYTLAYPFSLTQPNLVLRQGVNANVMSNIKHKTGYSKRNVYFINELVNITVPEAIPIWVKINIDVIISWDTQHQEDQDDQHQDPGDPFHHSPDFPLFHLAADQL